MLEVIVQENQREADTAGFWYFISHRHRLLFITLRFKKDKNLSIDLSVSHEGPMLASQYCLKAAIPGLEQAHVGGSCWAQTLPREAAF